MTSKKVIHNYYLDCGQILRIHLSSCMTEATISFCDTESVGRALNYTKSLSVRTPGIKAFSLGSMSNSSSEEDNEFNLKASKKIEIIGLPSDYNELKLLSLFQGCGTVDKLIQRDT